jgi:dephospho-CoA kinase
MIGERLEQARAEGVPRVVLDVPLLLENDGEHPLVGLCDALVFIDCDEDERSRRASQRGWGPGELERREAAQLPPSEKKRRADQVLPNRGSVAELEDAARELLRRLGAD